MEIKLVPHDLKYAQKMSILSSNPLIQNTLGLSKNATSIEGTKGFIDFILNEENKGNQYSRVILNESNDLIGVITLKDIDKVEKSAHIGTWIGVPYWGKGYNQLAKEEILKIAFEELNLELVFAGAKISNIRSIRAQEKLPYVTLDVGVIYHKELTKIEEQTKEQCILNVIEKDKFLNWIKPK